MQHIFASASAKDGFILTNPHQFSIYLPKSSSGWRLCGQTAKTAELWLEGVNRRLLLLGITDVQCLTVPPEKDTNQAYRFNFYFGSEFQRYQFEADILPKRTGIFRRQVSAPSVAHSTEQQRNVERFRELTELDFSIFRTTPTKLTITTSSNHDDLIIAMQLANKRFDLSSGAPASPNKKVPLLLRSNEKV